MPFGPVILPAGQILFRLWAPSAGNVELCLHSSVGQILIEMESNQEGWFHAISDQAKVGTNYNFVIDHELLVPDPASRFQPDGVHGPSQVIDPRAFDWRDKGWLGLPWEAAVTYEMHVGTFSTEGTFRAVRDKLDYLVQLGVTAIELMPLAEVPGSRNWGYDGVLLFAPYSRYGRPEELKELIQAAHEREVMVFLDVVYNHFGPEGNYLHAYAKPFFTDRYDTPWGSAINFDGPDCLSVRQFFINNALFWLNEYHLDGLRLDAVHAIYDNSKVHILEELAETIRKNLEPERHVHLILENDDNQADFIQPNGDNRPRWYTAQWNDDLHHALHVLATGESSGYYADYVDSASERTPVEHLGRALTQGFAYQGERSTYRDGRHRGQPSGHLPATVFVGFLQNHDQIGNRAFGERIQVLASEEAIKAMVAVHLLSPSPPVLFMGQEWGTEKPFLYFCNMGPELAPLVTAGRRKEFAKFPEFSEPMKRDAIPDPCDQATFLKSVLDWSELLEGKHRQWFDYYEQLIALRRREIIPRLADLVNGSGAFRCFGCQALRVTWSLRKGGELALLANLSDVELYLSGSDMAACLDGKHGCGRLLFQSRANAMERLRSGIMYPWTVIWSVTDE